MKKILTSVAMLAFVGAVVVGATTAYFSDTETSVGNTFTAGKLNLEIDNTCHYNGKVCICSEPGQCVWQGTDEPCYCTWGAKDLTNELFFNLLDVKPGDSGEDTISLHIDNNDAWVCAEIANLANDDNGCDSPENKIDTTCGANEGELQQNLFFSVWKDDGAGEHACNNIKDDDETYIIQDQPAQAGIWPIADSTTGAPIPGDTTVCYGVSWNVPLSTSNIIQTDSLTGDVIFTAVQSRHMDTFKCSDLTPTTCIPSEEVCDGIDNDCDGQIDEDGASLCNDGLYCNGAETCTAGICVSPGNPCHGHNVGPACDDSCDEANDNCTANDNDGTSCTGGSCQSGSCILDCIPTTEICNGLDDDCDGEIDEGNPGGGGACSTGLPGICGTGTLNCIAGSLQCGQNQQAVTEVCDNQLDDDCDGEVDEGCVLAALFVCTSGAECNDGNPCTIDTCTAGACGHINSAIPSCDDGNACTSMDSCQLDGTCWGAPLTITADFDSCTIESCNQVDGVTITWVPDGVSCSDLDCTIAGNCGTCLNGNCTTNQPPACTISANCNDSNACTNDACSSGKCIHTAVNCNDGNPLTIDICNPASGCIYGACITYYYDYDGDGYGTNVNSCLTAPTGNYRALQTGDCNDSNGLVNPGMTEICGNFIDDNCNGVIDEGGTCYSLPVNPVTTPPGGCSSASDCDDSNAYTIDACVSGSCVNYQPITFPSFDFHFCLWGICI